MKTKVLVFAGTTEGRQICEFLSSRGFCVTASVATEYGAFCLENIDVIKGRLSAEEIGQLVKDYDFAVDATHPYAPVISENIRAACSSEKLVHIIRAGSDKAEYFRSVQDICCFLQGEKGNVLLTTGSKDLKLYTGLENYRERLYPRVLPSLESIKACEEIGLKGKNIICMQGPFSTGMNAETIKHVNASFLVTKDTGEAGGFYEKLEAAEQVGIKALVLARPVTEDGLTLREAMDFFERLVK